MKKILAYVAAVALSALSLGAQAQKPSPGKMGKMGGTPAMAKPPAGKGGVVGTSKGTVKGAPTATGFTLTTAKGDVTVDASGAKYRPAMIAPLLPCFQRKYSKTYSLPFWAPVQLRRCRSAQPVGSGKGLRF